MSNLNRPNFSVVDSGAQANIILLSVGVGLAFTCCLCVYRRCYPRYDEFTTLRNDDSDFMPILVGSPLGLLSPLHTVAAGTASFFDSLWKSLFGKRKKTKKKGGFLNNPFMDRFMSPEARERLYALAQVSSSDLPESSSTTTRRAETVAAKDAKAKAKVAKKPLTASNYFDTEDIDIDIETTPMKPTPLLAVPTPTAVTPTFRQVTHSYSSSTHPLPTITSTTLGDDIFTYFVSWVVCFLFVSFHTHGFPVPFTSRRHHPHSPRSWQ